jgi:4-amino-4-deoxy-L-arabinose transferase-like glycosyltransferase
LTESRKYLLFITALHILFFVLALNYNGIITPDSEDYLWQAENIKTSGSFYATNPGAPLKIDYYSKRPPLYALLIIAITAIVDTPFAVLFVQNLLSIFCAWLVYTLLTKHFRVKRAGLWAGLLFALFPNQLMYANMVMSEIWLEAFVLLAFYSFIKHFETGKLKWVYINQAVLALALLTKPVMVYFWVINIILFLIIGIQTRRYWLPLTVLVLPLVVALWSAKNKADTGYYHYSSITHVNLKDYNTKYFLFDKYGANYGDSIITIIDNKANSIPGYATRCRYIKDTCSKIILSDIPTYGKFHAKGMINFMADPGRYDYVNFFKIPQEDGLGLLHYISKGNVQELKQFISTQPLGLIIMLLVQMLANGLVLLLVLAFVFLRAMPLWPKIYLIALGGYVWFLTGPIGSARFKMPVYPLIIIAAVLVVSHLSEKRKLKI